jgi:hypothetical protein
MPAPELQQLINYLREWEPELDHVGYPSDLIAFLDPMVRPDGPKDYKGFVDVADYSMRTSHFCLARANGLPDPGYVAMYNTENIGLWVAQYNIHAFDIQLARPNRILLWSMVQL